MTFDDDDDDDGVDSAGELEEDSCSNSETGEFEPVSVRGENCSSELE